MSRDRRLVPLVFSAALSLLGCGAHRVESALEVPPCPDAPGVIGGALVAVTSVLTPASVLDPEDAGARFVFDRGYETLLRLDCTGRVVPGLAASWTASGPARYVFALRDGARFWNGEPVTASAIVSAWRATAVEQADELLAMLTDSARVTELGSLELFVARGDLTLLASPGIAVRRSRANDSWPEGSGSHRISSTALRNELQLAPVAAEPMLRVVSATPAAARDLIDAGLGLMLTGDVGVVAYAASRPGVETRALGWDRAWVLAIPGRRRTDVRSTGGRDGLRRSLVRSAGEANTRGASDIAWLTLSRACVSRGRRESAMGALGTRARIVYATDQPVARVIAERLVALAASEASRAATETVLAPAAPELVAAGSQLTTAGLSRDAFNAALRAGTDVAFIASVPASAMYGCADAQSVLRHADWLSRDGETVDDAIVVPLVATRWNAVTAGPGRAP